MHFILLLFFLLSTSFVKSFPNSFERSSPELVRIPPSSSPEYFTVPVDKLDVTKYVGKWYQVYGAPTNVVFQGYGKCITAEYGLLTGGNVSVLNAQLNAKNELEQIAGYAYYKNVSEPGKLTVHLDGTPVDGPYWVIALGEIKNNQYQYSIVTSPSGISLWVLARNVNLFMRNYDVEVRAFLDADSYKYMTIEQDRLRCMDANETQEN
jgi:apolipoprotein D and lipocalin family protein